MLDCIIQDGWYCVAFCLTQSNVFFSLFWSIFNGRKTESRQLATIVYNHCWRLCLFLDSSDSLSFSSSWIEINKEEIALDPCFRRFSDWGHTYPFPNREVRPYDIIRTDQEDISNVEVVRRNVNAAQFFLADTPLENDCRRDEAKCIFPNSRVPYDGHFLEGIRSLICKTNPMFKNFKGYQCCITDNRTSCYLEILLHLFASRQSRCNSQVAFSWWTIPQAWGLKHLAKRTWKRQLGRWMWWRW